MRAPLAALLLWLAAPAAATAFEDAATGFAVAPIPGATIQPASRRQFDVGVAVDPDSGFPPRAGTGAHLCEAGFKAAPQNATLTQAEIDAAFARPEWANMVRSIFELTFAVTSLRRVRLDGANGFAVEARPKFGPDHDNARAFLTLHETPKGRVTLVCVTTAAAWRKAAPFFRRVAGAIRLPR